MFFLYAIVKKGGIIERGRETTVYIVLLSYHKNGFYNHNDPMDDYCLKINTAICIKLGNRSIAYHLMMTLH